MLRGSLDRVIVWYPHSPFTDVGIHVPFESGATLRGFRAGNISLSVRASALQNPGWSEGLRRLWLRVSQLVIPFYGEIREGAPRISVWWWNGIPDQQGVAATLLGGPYVKLWPEFSRHAQQLGDTGLEYVLDCGLQPPVDLAQPSAERIERDPVTGEVLSIYRYSDTQYPLQWPFSGPRLVAGA